MAETKVSQETFMQVKEKLDYYRLPTSFPPEATSLLLRVLNLVDQGSGKPGPRPVANVTGEGLSAALKHEMAGLLRENNKLHMDLMCARQEIQSLEHKFHKLQANKHSDTNQLNKYSQLKHKRELELEEELRQVRYKYNEIMNFLHEDHKCDREYIKRLMKHKQVEVDQGLQRSDGPPAGSGGDYNDYAQRVRELEAKVKNREGEILRLQNKMQYDGMDMNKIIRNFEESQIKKRLKGADNHIKHLEQSFDKIQKENATMRSKNGSKEALRIQVEKCHKVIDGLKKQNAELRRQDKEQDYAVKKQTNDNDRKIQKVREEKQRVERELVLSAEQNGELMKKVGFLSKQIDEYKDNVNNLRSMLVMKEEEIEELGKKEQETKLFYEYELETFKKKLLELEIVEEETRNRYAKAEKEIEVLMRENHLKSESIDNLQKIVNELIRKNQLAELGAGPIEQQIRKNDQIESQMEIVRLEQLLESTRADLETRVIDCRELEEVAALLKRENQKLRAEAAKCRNELELKEKTLQIANEECRQLRELVKKEKTESYRREAEFKETVELREKSLEEVRQENKRLKELEGNLTAKLRDVEVKRSEQEGVHEIAQLKLVEKQERIKTLDKLLSESVERVKQQSGQLGELDQKNHDLTREVHRLTKKFEEVRKESEDFKATTFRQYEAAVNQSLNEVSLLKGELRRVTESEQRMAQRYEESANLVGLLRHQKDLMYTDKISLERENDHLKIRVSELQSIERALVIENQNLRNIAHRV